MVVAFIPARGGSERIPRKNIRMLNGHPLLAYAIAGAKRAGIFDAIYVSTEDQEIAEVAKRYGAKVIDRPAMYSRADSPDVEWVSHAVRWHFYEPPDTIYLDDCAVILRPSNPFRTHLTIERAYSEWILRNRNQYKYDSMRAVEPVKQHPLKMWESSFEGTADRKLIPASTKGLYDMPTQSFSPVYAQNGCIQIFWRTTLDSYKNQTGAQVMPFFTEGYEGLDLNTEEDWILAEALLERGLATLEVIE